MRIISLLLAVAFLLVPLSAYASVKTTNYSGVTAYISQVKLSVWKSLELRNADDNSLPTITLTITDTSYLISSDKAQITVDGNVSSLKLTKTYRTRSLYRNRFDSRGTYELTDEQVATIRTANTVSLRMTFVNSYDITWNVPPKVLDEWKDVLSRKTNQSSPPSSLGHLHPSIN